MTRYRHIQRRFLRCNRRQIGYLRLPERVQFARHQEVEQLRTILASTALILAVLHGAATARTDASEERWLAGDHHVHTIYSASYPPSPEGAQEPPDPVIGGDAGHTLRDAARQGRAFGLDWMVLTDHGGPGHSALNHALAWPEIVAARAAMPDMVLFYGMEFDVPGGEHASLILPVGASEREMLRAIESGYGKREAFPPQPDRNSKPRMIAALGLMAAYADPPVIIANHPSRTATGAGMWGLHSPQEYRVWAAIAPGVAIGMEGAPGHQAARPETGKDKAHGARGLYGGYPTLGGFDQMTATLGGGWDALLGQGLRWIVTANSDFHRHHSEGGADFWPGEYAKTWVWARPNGAAIIESLRAGKVFATTGDLIDRLDFAVAAADGSTARLGDTLASGRGGSLAVTIRFRPGRSAARGGAAAEVDHVDLIIGERSGAVGDTNPTARVLHRFTASDWRSEGEERVISATIAAPATPSYLRLRGTNTARGEPAPDPLGEDPWSDLWFYSSPIYLEPR